VANRLVNKFLEELIAGKNSSRSSSEILRERFGEGPTLFERLVLFSKNAEKDHNYEITGQLTSLLKKLSPDQEAFLFANTLGTAKKAEKGQSAHKDAHDVLDWIVENKLGGQEGYYDFKPKGANKRTLKDIQELGAKLLNTSNASSGRTPLHLALENLRLARKEKSAEKTLRSKEVVKVLLDNGANPMVADAAGLTSARFATKLGDLEVTKYFADVAMKISPEEILERQIEAFEAYLRGGSYQESIRKILTQFPPVCPGLSAQPEFLEMLTCRHPKSQNSLLDLAISRLENKWKPEELKGHDDFIKNMITSAVTAMSGNRDKLNRKAPQKWDDALMERDSGRSTLFDRLVKVSKLPIFKNDKDNPTTGSLRSLVTKVPLDQQIYLFTRDQKFMSQAWNWARTRAELDESTLNNELRDPQFSKNIINNQNKSGDTALHLTLQNLKIAKERVRKGKTAEDREKAQKDESRFRDAVGVLLSSGICLAIQML